MARPQGAKNIKTLETIAFREKFRNYCLFSGGFERFMDELESIKGRDYAKYFLAALEFAEPKLARSVDKDGNDVLPTSINVKITDERGPDSDSVSGVVHS